MRPQRRQRARDERPDARGRQAENLADLLVREVALVTQVDDLPLAVRQHAGESRKPEPELRPRCRILGIPWLRAVVAAEREPRNQSATAPTVDDKPSSDD